MRSLSHDELTAVMFCVVVAAGLTAFLIYQYLHAGCT